MTDRGPLSVPLWFTIDTTNPAANATLDMIDSSDSFHPMIGTNTDDLTNINAPAFDGVAEANAKIRITTGGRIIGQGVVNSDESDGNAKLRTLMT